MEPPGRQGRQEEGRERKSLRIDLFLGLFLCVLGVLAVPSSSSSASSAVKFFPSPDPPGGTPVTATADRLVWLPYVAPMGAFLLLTMPESWLPTGGSETGTGWYPAYYAAKI